MSNLPKVRIGRRESARGLGRVSLLGVVAAFGLLAMVPSMGAAQALREGPKVMARVQQELAVQMPEVVMLRDQHVVSSKVIGGQVEMVLAMRVGGNVAMRLEIAPQADANVLVQDATGQWQSMDQVIVVAHEARGNFREVRVVVRVSAAEGAAVMPIVRAVADR